MEQTVLGNSSSLTLQKHEAQLLMRESQKSSPGYDPCYSELLQQSRVIVLFHEPLINTQAKIKNRLTHTPSDVFPVGLTLSGKPQNFKVRTQRSSPYWEVKAQTDEATSQALLQEAPPDTHQGLRPLLHEAISSSCSVIHGLG